MHVIEVVDDVVVSGVVSVGWLKRRLTEKFQKWDWWTDGYRLSGGICL